MAKHLPDPVGEPDAAARLIIKTIEEYLRSDRDPLVITRGLRHIYHRAELAWDESVAKAKDTVRPDGRKVTYLALTEATGDKMATLQGRIKTYKMRGRSKRK